MKTFDFDFKVFDNYVVLQVISYVMRNFFSCFSITYLHLPKNVCSLFRLDIFVLINFN